MASSAILRTMAEALLSTVALAVLAIAAAGYLALRLRLPPILGYLAAGLALSPHALGRGYFPEDILDGVVEVGVLFLLFLIGLELDLGRLRKTLRTAAWVLPFDLLLPALGAGLVARLLGWSLLQSLALGITVALSSTILGERLTSHRAVSSGARERVLGVLIAEDVAAGVLLTLLAALGGGAAASGAGVAWSVARLLFFLVLLTAGALLLVPRILDEVARRHVHELVVLWAVGLVTLWGYLGHLAGSAELGAFVAGVAAAEAGSRFVARNAVLSLRDAAVALFFFASGLATDVVPLLGDPLPVLGLAAAFLLAKILVHVPAAIASGLRLGASLQTGFALGTLGEFTLILVAVADRSGLAHPDLHHLTVGALVLLLPTAALLMRAAPRLDDRFRRLPAKRREPWENVATALRRFHFDHRQDPSLRKTALRGLFANLLLLVAFLALLTWATGRARAGLPETSPLLVQAVTLGIGLAAGAPLAVALLRHYRSLVWSLVGLRPGERVGAGKVRARLVDALVAATAVLALAYLALFLPSTVPVLVVAGVVAVAIGVTAWRALGRFHQALEDTVARILGKEETEVEVLLDQVLREHPWGVRSTAVGIPPDSPVARRTLESSRIAALTGAMVAVLHRRGRETLNPAPATVLLPGDTLVLLGDPGQLARAEALIVAHGEALRLATQSRHVRVEEVTVTETSAWAGKTLGEADLRAAAGVLVAGVWPKDAHRPGPYEPDRVLRAGDRLLVVGSALQVERAAKLAGGE